VTEETEETVGSVSQDGVTAYLSDLSRVPRLSADQQHDLHAIAQESGSALAIRTARDLLWKDALRLVLMVEKRLRRSFGLQYPDPDMIQEGNLAAGKAVETWDPQQGAFSTWVAKVCGGAMLDYMNEASKGGIGSKSASVILVDMDEPVAFTPEQAGSEDRPGMKGAVAGLPRGDLLTYQGVLVGGTLDGTGTAPIGLGTPEEEVYREQLGMGAKEEILRLYYGLDGTRMTLTELAKHYGLSVTGARKRVLAAQKRVKLSL
jgi:hypothetical protein